MKNRNYLSILFVALVLAVAAEAVKALDPNEGNAEPAEGFINTPDKVKIFYKIECSGTDTLVAVHGGPGNSLESIRPDFEPLAKNRRVI